MPVTKFDDPEKYRYQSGFSSYLETEAVPDTLPIAQNSPQQPAHGLYVEKLSGTSFTAPRHENKQTWLYRILPACAIGRFEKEPQQQHQFAMPQDLQYLPDQLRWDPFEGEKDGNNNDFVDGLRQMAGAGDPTQKQGLGIYVYAAQRSMDPQTAFCSADGDLLVVPQQGTLDVRTELGWLLVRPMEMCLIPRGIRFQVMVGEGKTSVGEGKEKASVGEEKEKASDSEGKEKASVSEEKKEKKEKKETRGYVLELYQGHFALPSLGPIGSNGLANERDFQAPVACFDDVDSSSSSSSSSSWTLRTKMNQTLYRARQDHSPFDVVAWHGTYYPTKYDLGRFNTIGTVSYDHPDPSIFTVLTAPSSVPGTAVADFAIFPPRWLVADQSFRPPWFHRNTMSEFMGLIAGTYDAKGPYSEQSKNKKGFLPGGASLHNIMSGHGPDAAAADAARHDPAAAQGIPVHVGQGSCAFMFESSLMLGVTGWARTTSSLQEDYADDCWGGLPRYWRSVEGGVGKGHLL